MRTSNFSFHFRSFRHESGRGHRFATKLAVLAMIAIVGASGAVDQAAAVASGTSKSAAQLYASAVNDALSQASVSWVSVTAGKQGTITVTSETGATSGIQEVSLSKGFSGNLDVILVNGIVYAKGNEDGLSLGLGLTDKASKQEAGQWISVQPSSSLFADQAEGLTVKSVVAGLTLKAPFSMGQSQRIDGQLATGIKGTRKKMDGVPAMPGLLYVSNAKNPLPLQGSESHKGLTFTINYSHWGGPIMISPPTTSIPLQPSWVDHSD